MKRHLVVVAIVAWAVASPRAQQISMSGPDPSHRPGWTFTPSFGFGETYDDNISLFGVQSGVDDSDDVVQTYQPGADVHYEGRHTQFGIGYSGSFLNYQTFSALNRWSQHGRLSFRRQENARLKWFGRANVLSVPSTDFADVGGLPFRRTGAVTSDASAGFAYAFTTRDSVIVDGGFQTIHFEEPITQDNILHGGRVASGSGGWRHKMSTRLALGADYSFRRSLVFASDVPFDLHSVEGGVDVELSPSWVFNGSAGVIYLSANEIAPSKLGPAWRLAIERRRQSQSLIAEYMRSYNPSFGFGGTVRSEEVSVTLQMPLFHSRRFYTTQRVLYRDDAPLASASLQLPLRSLRTHSIFGWAPQPWVRVEGFYARTQQNNRLEFGQLYRNRLGFQIVTSKPMRMQ